VFSGVVYRPIIPGGMMYQGRVLVFGGGREIRDLLSRVFWEFEFSHQSSEGFGGWERFHFHSRRL